MLIGNIILREPTIVFEDSQILVIDKPAGMVVNRAETAKEETVQDWVEKKFKIENLKFKIERAGIVHRLDKETSGLLLIAKTPEAFQNLQKQFKERKVKKKYLALVHGKVEPGVGEIRAPVGRLPWSREKFGIVPGGREAKTKYAVIATRKYTPQLLTSKLTSHISPPQLTLLELIPETGRTHQIRVHLKYLGHPIVSDEKYAGRKTSREDRKWCPRMFLHASYLGFFHPKKGKWIEFSSPLPEDLKIDETLNIF
ncbi:MAG: RluA family pseudouridine synthase [Patescibacteria group bacterium]